VALGASEKTRLMMMALFFATTRLGQCGRLAADAVWGRLCHPARTSVCRALGVSERHGWTRFVSMQNLVNLLYREEEREMLPLCAAEGIGVIPSSPQTRGRLTRDWDYTSIRTETDDAHQRLFAKSAKADRKVVDRVAEVTAARGVPRAQVAWLLAKPVITAPIVGATKLHHLDDALASVNVKLSADEITSLEEPYVPHAVVGFV
jgi:aryl-alcohol dehydrogenase-like predicted oxidoreductase